MAPVYPLPAQPAQLEALASRLEPLAVHEPCLRDAHFHAWRGAVLLALGRPAEAIAPLERALMMDPHLPGAELDLAQAFAQEGDGASAAALLRDLSLRPDVPPPLRTAIDVQLARLQIPGGRTAAGQKWQTRVQLTAMAGGESNLNNAPANSQLTLTIDGVDVVLPLDPSSQPRRGAALMNSVLWQGLRQQGESLWVLHGELKARSTGDGDTQFAQADLSAAWLQAPAAPAQWVLRAGASYLRFGGALLFNARRFSAQRQGAPVLQTSFLPACRPTGTGEYERREYPQSFALDGGYLGLALGLQCRGNGPDAGEHAPGFQLASYMNMELRLGEERARSAGRVGGTYRRGEIRLQAERPLPHDGRGVLQWSTTRQTDSEPYSALLGNVPRRSLRHVLLLEASWPIAAGLAIVVNGEAAWQRSNIAAFASRQRSAYVGLRWDL